jgi:hypothetical protein
VRVHAETRARHQSACGGAHTRIHRETRDDVAHAAAASLRRLATHCRRNKAEGGVSVFATTPRLAPPLRLRAL